MDLNAGTICLTFSETVSWSSFNVSGLRIAASSNPSPQQGSVFSLTLASAVGRTDAPILILAIGTDDLNMLKAADSVLRSQDSSYLQVNMGTVTDAFGNPMMFYPYQMASAYQADVTPPTLVSFRMDQSVIFVSKFVNRPTMSLTLQFSESVRVSTLQPWAITLQSNRSLAQVGTQSFTLTNLSFVAPTVDPTVVAFKLAWADSNSIKVLLRLCKSLNTTLLSITSNLISDMANNNVVTIPTTSALVSSFFNPDTLPPVLWQFAMDLNLGRAVLTFDEPVWGASFIPTQVTLQNAVDKATKNLTLTGGLGINRIAWVMNNNSTTFDAPNSNVLVVHLTLSNLNQLKAMHFCTQPDDCYFVHTGTLVRDIAGNYIVACR